MGRSKNKKAKEKKGTVAMGDGLSGDGVVQQGGLILPNGVDAKSSTAATRKGKEKEKRMMGDTQARLDVPKGAHNSDDLKQSNVKEGKVKEGVRRVSATPGKPAPSHLGQISMKEPNVACTSEIPPNGVDAKSNMGPTGKGKERAADNAKSKLDVSLVGDSGQSSSNKPMEMGLADTMEGKSCCGILDDLRKKRRNLSKRLTSMEKIKEAADNGKALDSDLEKKLKDMPFVDRLIQELDALLKKHCPLTTDQNRPAALVVTDTNNIDTGKLSAPEESAESGKGKLVAPKQISQPGPPAGAVSNPPITRSYSEAVTSYRDRDLPSKFYEFLDTFCCSGDMVNFYHLELESMVLRGASRILVVHYHHIIQKDRKLARMICNAFKRIRGELTAAAREFMQKVLPADNSWSSLEVQIVEMPERHHLIGELLGQPVEHMNVVGHRGEAIMVPKPDPCWAVQRLLSHMLQNHRLGRSWGGQFTIGEIEQYGDKVEILPKPRQYEVGSPISLELIIAMELDFIVIADSVLCKFYCPGKVVPFLIVFRNMLRNMKDYRRFWTSRVLAENLRQLIEHHPFMKPPVVRGNFMSGIHSSCDGHDSGDRLASYRTVLEGETPTDSWINAVEESDNEVLIGTLMHNKPAGAQTDYKLHLLSYSEYRRNHFQHATERTFGSHVKPRQQLTRSLDELEVGSSVYLDTYDMKVLTTLSENNSLNGLLTSIWGAYKSCDTSVRK